MNERELYEAAEEGKRRANASGIDALKRDLGDVVQGAGKGVADTLQDVKKDIVKEDKPSKASRFDNADKLTENIREPEQDKDIYMSRKMRRRMGE